MKKKGFKAKYALAVGISLAALAAGGLSACSTQANGASAPAGSSTAVTALESQAAESKADGSAKTLSAMAASAAAGKNDSTGGITAAEAEEIALKAAGLSRKQIAFIHTEQDTEDGRVIYEVEFYTTDYKEYDYDIDAVNGAVLHVDYDAEFYDAKEASRLGRYLNGKPKDKAAQTKPGAFTLEQAKEKAVQHAGFALSDVQWKEAKTETDDGRQVYELEFLTTEKAEYSYEIDTETGEILSFDFELPDGMKESVSAKPQGPAAGIADGKAAAISAEEAKKLALARAGISAEQAARFEIKEDRDDGRLEYEGSFTAGGREYEFTIDAATGKITEWDEEDED